MQIDRTPVLEFLSKHEPFRALRPARLEALAAKLDIEYFRRGSRIPNAERLLIIRTGVIEEHLAGSLVASYEAGDAVGAESLMAEHPHQSHELIVKRDALVYTLKGERFRALCDEEPSIGLFFTAKATERLRVENTMGSLNTAGLSVPVGKVVRRSVVEVEGSVSIRQAAQHMTEARTSSVFIHHEAKLGIITDRDLRSRVVAQGLDVEAPAHTIMSQPLMHVDVNVSLVDVLMEMLGRGVHHLGVSEAGRVVAAVTASDLIQSLSANPVLLQRDLGRQTSLEDLERVSRGRADVALSLIDAGARASDVQRVLSHIADSILRRLVQLFSTNREHSLDPASFAWVSFGSQARQEAALGSDQDNGLVIADEGAAPAAVYAALAQWVCDGLNACGYPYCRGGIMASNEQWRQPLATWQRYFQRWVDEPSRDAVMRGSIFFDQRASFGNEQLVRQLGQHIQESVQRRPLFVAHLARDAQSRTPPIGWFGRFVLEQHGERGESLDLKHRGLIPIVDLARACALLSGCQEPNTEERLRWAAEHGALSHEGAQELLDALAWIAKLRLRHHAHCLRQARPLDNYLDPEELSATDRRHLRDAFSVVKTLQEAFAHRHQLGALSG